MRETGSSTIRPASTFAAYLLVFFLAWSMVWVRGIYPWAVHHLGTTTLAYALTNLGFRFAIWILPVLLYLRVVDRVNPADYLKLRFHWKRGLAIGLAISAANSVVAFWRFGPPHWHAAKITWNSVLSTSILMGFFAEIPFRGFILQKLDERFGFWIAATLSSVLFVAFHLPGWALYGSLSISNVVSIFVFGMIMAILFRYSRSLWAPIVAHNYNDFIFAVLYHQ